MLKYICSLFILLVTALSIAKAQVITITGNETTVQTNEKGALLINVSAKDIDRFKKNGFVRYSDFGAKGDGKTDDIDAIAATHAFANKYSFPVKADDSFTYFISGKNRTAIVHTNTDFGKAAFVIDDTNVENRDAQVLLSVQQNNRSNSKAFHHLKKIKRKLMSLCRAHVL